MSRQVAWSLLLSVLLVGLSQAPVEATVTPYNMNRYVIARVNNQTLSQLSSAGGNFTASKTVDDQLGRIGHGEQNTTLDFAAGHFFGAGAASAVDENATIDDITSGGSLFSVGFDLDAPYRYDLHAELQASVDGGSAFSSMLLYSSTSVIYAFATSSAAGTTLNSSGLLGPGRYFAFFQAIAESEFQGTETFSGLEDPGAYASAHSNFNFNLQLTPTPEPATFVLVGLAGAGLLLRRRRVA